MLADFQPGAMKKFRRTPWRFQRTFRTPLKQLDLFTATIVGSLDGVESGRVIIDTCVFESKSLRLLLAQHDLQPDLRQDISIIAETGIEVQPLLTAVLADWIDFVFIPAPKPFIIHADHDEYATFYANTKGNLNKVADSLTAKGFAEIPDYTRPA
jgi:hypothetical protein